jgi:hypothetical protein
VAAVILLLLTLVASALAVYAIYRHGVIPAIRKLQNDTAFTGAWRGGGWLYRFSLVGIFMAVALALAAGAMLMTGLVWQAGVAFLAAVAIVPFANYDRFKSLQRYSGQ